MATLGTTAEFATVDAVLNTNAETCGVDAFALALIKSERQLRRLFTRVAYQFPAFSARDIQALRQTLGKEKGVYFAGLVAGFNALYSCSVENLVGPDYQMLRAQLKTAGGYRNKIFHGQITESERLSRTRLVAFVNDIIRWCELLGSSAEQEIGYDGFGVPPKRGSYRKCSNPDFTKYLVTLQSVADYERFIQTHMLERTW